jgi:hypothetical protein
MLQNILKDERFNIMFSFLVGIGIICIIKPLCSGSECGVIEKPPQDVDFDKYVYHINGNKCYEFKPEIIECPTSGAIEAFQECQSYKSKISGHDDFSRRISSINRCD